MTLVESNRVRERDHRGPVNDKILYPGLASGTRILNIDPHCFMAAWLCHPLH